MKAAFNILVICLVLLSGCKTTRKIETTRTQSSEVVKNNIQTKEDSSLQVHVVTNRIDSLIHLDSLSVKETVVELSKPDSSGLQYPVKVTYREASHVQQTNNKAKAIKDSTSTINKSTTRNDHTIKQAQTSTDSKVKTKTAHHRWYWIFVVAILVAIALFILKRYGFLTKAIGYVQRLLKFLSI